MASENTNTQLSVILEEIGTTANVLRGAVISGDQDTSFDKASLLMAAVAKIGWLADLGLEKLTGAPQIVGGPEQWFLPPSYPHTKATAETIQV